MSSVDLFESSDARAWRKALGLFQDVDIYSDPGYAALAAPGRRSCLLVTESRGGRLALPFVLNELPAELGFYGLKDAESPYGYPGIHFSGPPAEWESCWEGAKESLRKLQVVNVLIRLHPFHIYGGMANCFFGLPTPTAYIPLEDGRENAFGTGACSTHRSQVRRAVAMGFTVERVEAPGPEDWAEFRSMYSATMRRLASAESYHFPADYFLGLGKQLGPAVVLVRTRDRGGKVLCQALFLAGDTYAHYHLSCRSEDCHNVASHLLFEEAADWAQEHRLIRIHLGGGTSGSPADPLYLFKQRIGRGRSAFQMAGMLVDPLAHQALVEKWESNGGIGPRWFQAYRQPIKAPIGNG